MSSSISESCSESLDLTINNFVNFFSESKEEKVSKTFNALKLMGSVVLLACLFPALPFIVVMAATLAIMKYFVLRIRNL